MKQKAPLGKGLGALFPELSEIYANRTSYRICQIEELIPNRFQPRRDFSDEEQSELVASIKEQGIIQPIIVRKIEGGYEIIAGERRWRAAQDAGLKEVPVVVREASDLELAEISLIENLQRADLNPIEEAQAYQVLIEKFNLTQEDIATRVGKDRSTVTNALRLIRLPEEAKKALVEKRITSGHARALLSLPSTKEILTMLKEIISRNLSVRETEALVKRRLAGPKGRKEKDTSPLLTEFEREASSVLQARVKIKSGKRGGKIEIRYSSLDELNRLLRLILSRDL